MSYNQDRFATDIPSIGPRFVRSSDTLDFRPRVDDASTITKPELIKPNNIKSLQILKMKENRGHARCNAFGIRYVFRNKEFDGYI